MLIGDSHNVALKFGDKTPKVLVLKSNLAKSYASYCSIENDLKQVLKFYELLLKSLKEGDVSGGYHTPNDGELTVDSFVRMALFRAAIIAYAKAFNDSEGRNVRFDVNIFKDDDLKEYHKELMSQRNNYHAHAGNSKYEENKAIVAFDPDDEEKWMLGCIAVSMTVQTSPQIENYMKVVTYVLSHVSKKIQKCRARLKSEKIRPNLRQLFKEAQ